MLGPVLLGTVGVLGIFAAIVWFCWQAGRIHRDQPPRGTPDFVDTYTNWDMIGSTRQR